MRSYSPDDISSEEVAWFNRQVSLLLSCKTTGNLLQTVKNLEAEVQCRGAEALDQDCESEKGSKRKPCPRSHWQDPQPETQVLESWDSYVNEFEGVTNRRMAEGTKMNSLRQLVPIKMDIDMTRLTLLDTRAELKKYVLIR